MECLFNSNQIQNAVVSIAEAIKKDFSSQPIVLLGVLKGAFVFVADLARALYPMEIIIDFIQIGSYGNRQKSQGKVVLIYPNRVPLRDKNVIVVEDVLDTGNSLAYLWELLQKQRPKTLRLAVLIEKENNNPLRIKPHYIGLKAPNRFLVGYGLDYAEQYRHLPYIAAFD